MPAFQFGTKSNSLTCKRKNPTHLSASNMLDCVVPSLPRHLGEYALWPLENQTAIGPNKHCQPWTLETRTRDMHTFDEKKSPSTELHLSARHRDGLSQPQAEVRMAADSQSMLVRVPPTGRAGLGTDPCHWDEMDVKRSEHGDGWTFGMHVHDGHGGYGWETFEWRRATPATSAAVRRLYAVRGRLAKAIYARVSGPGRAAWDWELVRTSRGHDVVAAVAGGYRTPKKCRKFEFTGLAAERVFGERFALVAYMTSLAITMEM